MTDIFDKQFNDTFDITYTDSWVDQRVGQAESEVLGGPHSLRVPRQNP